jgi:uncharacterized membrane protein (DUF2068 family)
MSDSNVYLGLEVGTKQTRPTTVACKSLHVNAIVILLSLRLMSDSDVYLGLEVGTEQTRPTMVARKSLHVNAIVILLSFSNK